MRHTSSTESFSFTDCVSARRLARRWFLRECALGLGGGTLATMLFGAGVAENPLQPREPHFPPRAKRVIFLFMAGGPSQLDLFDPKPKLAEYEGQPISDDVLRGAELPFIGRDAALMSSPFRFGRHGESGAVLSELLPGLASVVDDVAIVRSLCTDAFNHAPAQILLNTGHMLLGRPSMGAWATYGLGSEADDLPAYVVLNPSSGVSGGAACWGNGFLPSIHQGVPFRSTGDPVLFVANPPGHTDRTQRDTLDLVNRLNAMHLAEEGDNEIAARINSYELAFRLQASAPDLIDLGSETAETLELYGAEPGEPSFGATCLLARRLVEKGVRFVTCIFSEWDHHSDVAGRLRDTCGKTDRATAALVTDLKRRGLLDDTLVIWGGEFGRTPMVENNPALGRSRGRDHHPNAFTMWLAGGGVRGGQTIGVTDELGYHVVEDRVHVHDLQATALHLLGIDHTKLTYRFQGRDFRLTDVEGHVVDKLVA